MSTDNTAAPYPRGNSITGRDYPVPAEYRATTPQWWARNCYDAVRAGLYAVAAELNPGAVVFLDMDALMNAVLATGRRALDGGNPLAVRELVCAHTIVSGTDGDLTALPVVAIADRFIVYRAGGDMVGLAAAPAPTAEDALTPADPPAGNVPDLCDLRDSTHELSDFLDYALVEDLDSAADATDTPDLARLAAAVEDAIRPVRHLRHLLDVWHRRP